MLLADPTLYHIFYYMWFKSKSYDGVWAHWNENNHNPDSGDIPSNFYPFLGLYSSRDLSVINNHIQFIKRSGIGTLVLSWWGQGSYEDGSVLGIMNAAAVAGLKCTFLIDSYGGRSITSIVNDIAYLYAQYGSHPAFYRFARATRWGSSTTKRGVFYIYDAYTYNNSAWATAADGLRGTANDAILLTNNNPKSDTAIVNSLHFDGLYPYDVLNESGSDFANCGSVMASNNTLWSPSCGPGFNDQRERNGNSVISRNFGARFDNMLTLALASSPTFVSITSFNEWQEGTQIEPAVPFQALVNGFIYEDYSYAYQKTGVNAQYAYLDRMKLYIPALSKNDFSTKQVEKY